MLSITYISSLKNTFDIILAQILPINSVERRINLIEGLCTNIRCIQIISKNSKASHTYNAQMIHYIFITLELSPFLHENIKFLFVYKIVDAVYYDWDSNTGSSIEIISNKNQNALYQLKSSYF